MNIVLHITPGERWQEAQGRNEYSARSLETEGFIHCSRLDQLLSVANSIYAGMKDLVILVIDPEQVDSEIRYEDCYQSGQMYPHIYGPIPLSAIVQVHDFTPGPDGLFTLPIDLQ